MAAHQSAAFGRSRQRRHLGRHDRRLVASLFCAHRHHAHLTIALIFGFVAKEIVIGSLAVIYGLSGRRA